MSVKQISRGGKKVWVVHRVLRDDKGTQLRYRRDASVQTRPGAEADERELLAFFRDHRTIEGFRPSSLPPVEVILAPAQKTWADAVKTWRAVGLPVVRNETQVLYKKIAESKYLSGWDDLPLSSITGAVLGRLDVDLVHAGVGASRRRHFAAVYRGILKSALAEGWIASLPQWPPLPKAPRKEMAYPTNADVEMLVSEQDTCDKYRASQRKAARLTFAISAYTGLRVGEVRALRWGDIDWSPATVGEGGTGYVTVRRSRGSKGHEGPTKSGADRKVPIAPVLWPFLQKARVEAYERAKGARIDDMYVAVDRLGQPWEEGALRGALRRACVRLGIPTKRYHSLRHFFVTELFVGGASAPTVQKLAGHENLSVTQRYAHTGEAERVAAVGMLGRGNRVAMAVDTAPK